MSAITSFDVSARGGRTLRAHVIGREDAPVLVCHHGTPGCGRWFRAELESAEALGLRLVAYDRPGYAGSDPDPGRRVAGAAADVGLILDALGVERFATYGTSGGGPHALACAALLPERCAGAATVAGVGPSDAPDLDWAEGMGEGNLAELAAARRGRDHLLEFCRLEVQELAGIGAEQLADAMRPHLSAVDAAALTGELAEFLVEELQASVERGVEGWADDDLAFLAPWGFDVAAMAVPTVIWQGTHDLMVPEAHGHWLGRHVAGAEQRLSPADGHLTLFTNRIGEVHSWLGHALTN